MHLARACSSALPRPHFARPSRDGRTGVRPLYFNFPQDFGVVTSDCSRGNLLHDLGVEGLDCFLQDLGVEDCDCMPDIQHFQLHQKYVNATQQMIYSNSILL